MEVQLAFYFGPGDALTSIIRSVTGGPFSHVELVFSDRRCFSSSGRRGIGGEGGVRWVSKALDEGWWLVELPEVTPAQEAAAVAMANSFVGLPFDWFGLVDFVIPIFPKRKDRWYCSEICLLVIQDCFEMLPGVSRKIHPNKLFNLVSQ